MVLHPLLLLGCALGWENPGAAVARTNGKGKLTLEGKDELRSRGVNSPDRADAMVLAFCGGGGKRMDEYLKALGEDGRSLLERMEDEIGPVEETGSPLAGCEVGG